MAVAGDAVAAVEQAGAHAEEAAFAHPGHAERGAVGAHRAVGQPAAAHVVVPVVFVMAGVMPGVAGDGVVAGFPVQGVDVEHQRARGRGAIQAQHAGALVVAAGGPHFRAPLQRGVGGVLGDAALDHVHRAADRAAAVEQGRRSLEHFDLVGEEGLDRHCVVDADGGHVARGQAVAQHLYARALHAADDGPAHAGAEIGRLHAGQAAHGLAQGRGADLVEPAAGQHLDRAGEGFGGLRQGRGAHHQLVQILDLGVPGVVLLAREGGQGGQDQGQGHGKTGGGESGVGHRGWRPER